MHIDNVIFLILSKNAYTKFSAGPHIISTFEITFLYNHQNISGAKDFGAADVYWISRIIQYDSFNLLKNCRTFKIKLSKCKVTTLNRYWSI